MLSLHYAPTTSGTTPPSVASELRAIRCPVLVVHGTHDLCQPVARGVRMARLAGAELLVLGQAGHLPQARYPVVVNHAIEDFADASRPVRRPDTAGRPRSGSSRPP